MSHPLAVKCKPCGHVWAVCFLPIEMGEAIKAVQGAKCPMCGGGPKEIFMATDADIAAATTLKTNENRISD